MNKIFDSIFLSTLEVQESDSDVYLSLPVGDNKNLQLLLCKTNEIDGCDSEIRHIDKYEYCNQQCNDRCNCYISFDGKEYYASDFPNSLENIGGHIKHFPGGDGGVTIGLLLRNKWELRIISFSYKSNPCKHDKSCRDIIFCRKKKIGGFTKVLSYGE